MRVKLRKQKKLDIRNRVQSVTEIKEAIQFLYPELTADELQDKLVFILLTIAADGTRKVPKIGILLLEVTQARRNQFDVF
jgi:hypothetical protein